MNHILAKLNSVSGVKIGYLVLRHLNQVILSLVNILTIKYLTTIAVSL